MAIVRAPLPSHLGPYEVGAKIAGGGMATVYLGRATSPDGTERVVALKVIKDELADQQTFVHMFLDEAKILSRLSHPNIIETREFGITGIHRFIAMELLLGRTLMDLWDILAARGERVPTHLGAWIGARVADGLHYAHELTDDDGTPLQVIHRDVNPSNIFLTYDGRVKLIDFGLAKAVGRRARSAAGIVKGKLPYLSPEQVTEDTVDRRTDLYALGTTLWEMGTGKRLFKRDTDVATVEAIGKAVIPDPRTIVPDYPEALWAIVKKALEPKRVIRHATALEMGRMLDQFVKSGTEDVTSATLEKYLADLFDEERRKQSAWVRAASKIDPAELRHTMPPPVPIGLAQATVPPPPVVPKGPISVDSSELEDALDSVPPARGSPPPVPVVEVSQALPLVTRKTERPASPTPPSTAVQFKPVSLSMLQRDEEERRRWVIASAAMALAWIGAALMSLR